MIRPSVCQEEYYWLVMPACLSEQFDSRFLEEKQQPLTMFGDIELQKREVKSIYSKIIHVTSRLRCNKNSFSGL